MAFQLGFLEAALKEWEDLDGAIRLQLKNKLAERLQNPRVPASRMRGHPDRYKIKLRSSGFRLVYEVRDAVVTVVVIAVGKRDRSAVYTAASKR